VVVELGPRCGILLLCYNMQPFVLCACLYTLVCNALWLLFAVVCAAVCAQIVCLTMRHSAGLLASLCVLLPSVWVPVCPLLEHLQVDMDYENLSRPPPAPTEEATQSLEDMIKRRIAEARLVCAESRLLCLVEGVG
jgi:hypothetical protein